MEQDSKIKTMKALEKWREMLLKEQKIKKRSQRTIILSKIEIDKFFEFLRECEDFNTYEDFEHNLIKMYLFELSEKFEKKNKRAISSRTLNLAISRLKSFFKYITDNNDDLLDFSRVFSKIKATPSKSELPRFSSEDNLKIANALKNAKPRSFRKRRLLFAMTLLYYGGLRSAELLSLCPDNFTLERKGEDSFYVITFIGKGNKKRSVPIPIGCLHCYEDFILSPYKQEKIFSITYRALLMAVEKFLGEIGVRNFSGLHSFRHNLATLLVERNVNMQVISEILGHSSILTTTKFYSRVNIGVKAEALRSLL